jgi:glutathione synthase/RimK-type ligase-like ATP-grasp enzyme
MKNVKIGIIIDKYHLERKVSEFLSYLKKIAQVNIYVEENVIISNKMMIFDEDIFFVKSKGDTTLNLIKIIKNIVDTPIINTAKGIWNAINRFIFCTLLAKAAVPIPEFTLNPSSIYPEFEDFIVKNIIDQRNYNFIPKFIKKSGHVNVFDERAIKETEGGSENYQYYFYQKFIDSKWEYKVYGIGEELQFFYRQIPVLYNPNKMESRVKIEKIPELSEYSFRAMEVLDLKMASIDYLKTENDQFYLTDINSTPNFNYIKNGPKIVGDYLLNLVRK